VTSHLQRLTIVVAAVLALAGPAHAASSTSSAASEGSSASVGSISDSIQGSSNSSTKKDTAEGNYRVIEVAEAAGRAGAWRLRLQPLQGAGAGFDLIVPRAALERADLGQGRVVSVRHRDFGIEFARADTGEAFFLALDDAWSRELQTRPVAL
jgi:hypothetical protein